MIVKLNPEFGIELVLGVPYAYYLHLQNELTTVITSKGMSPFYFFCDDVRETFNERTINNELAGLNTLPNNWIHHNAFALTGRDYQELSAREQVNINGVLDYSKWICPDFKKQYAPSKTERKTVMVTNKYNIEHGEMPRGYFDIPCLIRIFEMLIDRDYNVIYKRENNTNPEFAYDENELTTVQTDLVNGICGRVNWRSDIITDYELVNEYRYKGVTNLQYEVKQLMDNNPKMCYNEAQLRIFAKCDNYISVCGGNAILSAMFGGKVIIYVHKGKELRQNYFGNDSYFKKLSNSELHPVLDPVTPDRCNDYSGIYEAIENHFI